MTPGSIFVALGRYRKPTAILQALHAGAKWVLTDEAALAQTAADDRGRIRLVPDAQRAYALLSAMAQGMPGRHLVAVGVTGTNGKSLVATMLHWVLSAVHRSCGLVGTVMVDTGRRRVASGLTTPDAADLAVYLAEMREAGYDHVVMEVSSHGLEQRRTDGVRFKAGVFTNFSADHLDYHPSMEQYFAAKRRLFEMLGPRTWAVLNAGDPSWRDLASRTRAQIITFGHSPGAQFRATWLDERRIKITAPQFKAEGEIPGLGAYRVENAMAVLATAVSLDVPPDKAWQAIQRFPGLWRRLQIIEETPGWVVDDCAHNPVNIQAAIQAVRELRPRRLWVVYAVRGNRGIAINQANAAALVRSVRTFNHCLLLTAAEDLAGPDDRVRPGETLAYVETFRQLGQKYNYHNTVEAALSRVLSQRTSGDVVLLLGAHAMDSAQNLWWRLSRGNSPEQWKLLGTFSH